MTNETTASQTKPPSGSRCPCDSSGTCQDVCPDPATGLPLCASADCYSARKPKSRSIGDDAQFWNLMSETIESLHSDALYRMASTALIAYIDSRAPAAQASATIQAVPDDIPSTMEDARKLIQYLRIEIDSKVMELYDLKKKLAATIQEPIMVTEPVGLAKPRGWLAGNSSDGGEMMYWKREAAQSECDQHNAYERSRPDFDPESLREPEPVYAAPMVAYPAGVALRTRYEKYMDWCQRSGYDALTWPEFVDSRINSGQRHHAPITYGIAATVKAVPSDLTSIRCPVCCGSGSVDEPGDEAGSCESYGCEECHGQGKIIVDAEDVKAVPSEALDSARLRWLIEDHDDAEVREKARELAGRLGTSSYFAITRDIDAAMKFAAPLAGKTGGGE